MSKDLFVPCIVLLAMVFPQVALAEATAGPWQASKTMDVVLFHGGQLYGQVVNPQGHPKAGAVVFIRQRGRDVSQVRTDDHGRFAVKGLHGGSYELVTAGTARQIRAWYKITPPPAAAQVASLIVADKTVRGQSDALSDTYPGDTIDGNYAAVIDAADYVEDEAFFDEAEQFTYVGGNDENDEWDEAAYVEGNESTNVANNYSGNGHGHARHGHAHGAGHDGLRILGVRPWVWGGITAAFVIPLALDDDDAS